AGLGQDYFEKYKFEIFDRWGNKVFETTDSGRGWNGITEKSKKADAGVYFWIVNCKSNCSDKDLIEKGFVSLVR
ncbi:MAG: gliding motility-associated C-terminal domain-containing protein, partial [Bacteroidota bacterium]|nr:gliding motility-associated C-terminal domain-containing protein [Bacteroidota bacterium]